MTAEQVSHLTSINSNGRQVGSLSAVGGAAMVKNENAEAITTLKSVAGDTLRGNMQNDVRTDLGV